MHYLSLALYAEGPTDDRFLAPVLRRLCEELCAEGARGPVDISEVLRLADAGSSKDEKRAERIVAAAGAARGSWRVLFVHTDGGGDAGKARRERVDPGLQRLHQEMSAEGRGVGVVPVRETEAWMLVDGDALREVFGCTLDDVALGVPPAHALEREQNPKQVLRQCFDRARPGARARGRTELDSLSMLGETVSFQALRRLPAFRALEAELRAALTELKVIG